MPDGPVSHHWRKYLRLSGRAILVLVLVMGAGLGWLVRNARIQREAVVAIKAAGGSVEYDWESNKGKLILSREPWAPGWLVNLVGIDYFVNDPVTDQGRVHLKRLSNLSSLNLHGTQVTDAGLAHLKGLTKLADLDLSSTTVSDAGLVHLKGLSNLLELRLNLTQVPEAGEQELKQALPRLMIYH